MFSALQRVLMILSCQDCFHVVEGGVDTTVDLLREKFDYIFFTGSGAVGQKIRDAANKFLTPVTLELGGERGRPGPCLA